VRAVGPNSSGGNFSGFVAGRPRDYKSALQDLVSPVLTFRVG
jgi:acetyl esterase/lipase